MAQGNLEDDAPLIKALQYDLDLLQQLSVSLSGLAEYVGDTAPLAGPYWVSAGGSTPSPSNTDTHAPFSSLTQHRLSLPSALPSW